MEHLIYNVSYFTNKNTCVSPWQELVLNEGARVAEAAAAAAAAAAEGAESDKEGEEPEQFQATPLVFSRAASVDSLSR